MDKEQFIDFIENGIPFNSYLGVRVDHVEPGFIRLEIPWRDELVGDPERPALHGGVLSALADAAGGFVVWSKLDPEEMRVSTVDLRLDYLLPGRMETLVAEARVLRLGGRVGVADVRLFHHSERDATIATAKGVYSVREVRKGGKSGSPDVR